MMSNLSMFSMVGKNRKDHSADVLWFIENYLSKDDFLNCETILQKGIDHIIEYPHRREANFKIAMSLLTLCRKDQSDNQVMFLHLAWPYVRLLGNHEDKFKFGQIAQQMGELELYQSNIKSQIKAASI